MGLKQKLLRAIERTYEEERALVANLSDEERSAASTYEQWSVKDAIAHIAAWKEKRAQSMAAISRGEPVPAARDYEEVNVEIFAANQDRSWDKVLAYSQRAYDSLAESLETVPEADLVSRETSAEQQDRPLWRTIAGTGCTHPMLHLAELYMGRGQAGRGVRLAEETSDMLLQLDDSPNWRGLVRYNLACLYAISGQQEMAIGQLRRALQLNPDLTEWSNEDPDLVSIREHPDYRSLYSN